MKWIALIIVVLANVAAVVLASGPAFVTYVPVAPASLTCAACNSPEVKHAIEAAYGFGINGIIGQVNTIRPWLIGIGVFNVLAFCMCLFRKVSSNNSFKPKPLRGSA